MSTDTKIAPAPSKAVRIASVVSRILLGLPMLIFGLNKFFGFIALPPAPEAEAQLLGALGASGYMFPIVGGIEVLTGAMLLLNVQSRLALLLLAPVLVNIVLVHAFLNPAGLPVPVVLTAAMVWLFYAERKAFLPILG